MNLKCLKEIGFYIICFFFLGQWVGYSGADPWIGQIVKVHKNCVYDIQFTYHSLESQNDTTFCLKNITKDKLVPLKKINDEWVEDCE